MLTKIILSAAMAATAAPSAPSPSIAVQIPDYAQPVDLAQVTAPALRICQANFVAELQGNQHFLTDVINIAHLSPEQAHRLTELCAVFDAGAATLYVVMQHSAPPADDADDQPEQPTTTPVV